MAKVIGVRFRDNGKIYYFASEQFEVEVGQNVIVETARGVEYGRVVLGNREIHDEKIIATLKPVIRIATPEDDKIQENNKEKSKEAYKICIEKIKKHKLAMKLIDCEYTFDNNKVLFYFTADGRIDFGIGICGRSLCCNTFLSEFVPVSIKMAKEQNLSLNPTKISGVCGRLMCCLKNEQDTYEYLNSKLPNVGDEVKTNTGVKGVVHEVSVLRQRVKLVVTDEKGEKELVDYKVDDLIFRPRKRREKVKMDDELKKLEAMEKKERKSKL